MLDSFDYKEPQCSVCGGKKFYNPNLNVPDGKIPVDRIISKVDTCFDKNNFEEAGRLLEFWKNEAIALKDFFGELSMLSELIGYYRKVNHKEKAYECIVRAINLVKILEQENMSSGATVYLNCATAYKAFGEPEKAISLYEQAEKVYQEVLSVGDQRFGGLHNNMALALVDLKKFDKAEEYYLKAIKVMENIKNGQPDLAITYVNMAHLYEEMGVVTKITDCMFTAYNLLNNKNIQKNGYYAYVCEKCAPSFEHFGYKIISAELKKSSGEIYERS